MFRLLKYAPLVLPLIQKSLRNPRVKNAITKARTKRQTKNYRRKS